MTREPLFRSFFLGGFECSTHVRRDGRRLDLVASTRHDELAPADYRRLGTAGIRAARDGVRWHLVEKSPGRYDWSSALQMIRAAREADVQVAWDLLHFGWPDHVDVFSAAFPERFASFARAFAEVLSAETDATPFVAPVNEISFLSFAGGERGFFNPFAENRGDEMKFQLTRASILASEAVRAIRSDARLVHTDPIINVAADPTRPQDRLMAENYRQSQFASWDIIAGRARPELGGREDLLDVMGVNYYIHNQWIHEGATLVPSHPEHLLLRYMLREVWERYGRPVFIAETGIEGPLRGSWLRYVGREVRCAIALGVPVGGICLYPIVDHPGWEDDRHCPNGLWGYPDETGERPIDREYAAELSRQEAIFAGREAPPDDDAESFEEIGLDVLDSAAREMEELTAKSRE